MHPPTPREVALESDRPWESGGVHYSSVIQDGDRYRMWYRADTSTPRDSLDASSWICYAELLRCDDSRFRRCTLRTDGFVSVRGPYEGGEFVTPPLSIEGSNLLINYATTGGGSIRLELWVFSVEERVSLSTNGSQPTYCRNPHPSEREYQSAFFRSTISESSH